MTLSKKIVTAFFLIALPLPMLVFANGGDQRVVDGTYLINLSRAPFTPRVGAETSFLASFVDLEKNKLVGEDLIVKVRIAKLGGREAKREFVFEKDIERVEGGIMDFKYTFDKPGLHEIFFDFGLASNPQKMYEAPDFLLDVQKPRNGYNTNQVLMAVFGSLVTGLIAGWFIKRIVNSRVG